MPVSVSPPVHDLFKHIFALSEMFLLVLTLFMIIKKVCVYFVYDKAVLFITCISTVYEGLQDFLEYTDALDIWTSPITQILLMQCLYMTVDMNWLLNAAQPHIALPQYYDPPVLTNTHFQTGFQ